MRVISIIKAFNCIKIFDIDVAMYYLILAFLISPWFLVFQGFLLAEKHAFEEVFMQINFALLELKAVLDIMNSLFQIVLRKKN